MSPILSRTVDGSCFSYPKQTLDEAVRGRAATPLVEPVGPGNANRADDVLRVKALLYVFGHISLKEAQDRRFNDTTAAAIARFKHIAWQSIVGYNPAAIDGKVSLADWAGFQTALANRKAFIAATRC